MKIYEKRLKTAFKILIIIIIWLSGYEIARTDHCTEDLLLDGSEQLNSYGMDSTQNWWAVTSPFTNGYRLIVNGHSSDIYMDLKGLTFSADGLNWACFARDNKQWYLLTRDTALALPGTDPGEIVFSPNSQVLCFSFKSADQEFIFFKNRRIQVYQRTGRLYLSTGGDRIAFMGYRGDRLVMNVNGTESPLFDEIKPIGFWQDAGFLYAAKSGSVWEVYKNNQPISESFADIPEVALNIDGTVAGLIVRTTAGKFHGMIISDEYYEPLLSKPFDFAANLALHPFSPIIAFSAVYNTKPMIVMSNTEFYGGEQNGKPFFTCDGSDFFFVGCDIDCFVNVSGRKYSTNSQLSLESSYAMKPNHPSIAYSTSASLVIRSFADNQLYAGRMVDEVSSPRYNWRSGNYEALGKVNQRLYLLKCKF